MEGVDEKDLKFQENFDFFKKIRNKKINDRRFFFFKVSRLWKNNSEKFFFKLILYNEQKSNRFL